MAIFAKNFMARGGADGGVAPIIREYSSSATWEKPAGLHSVLVCCLGAGGGGGSGRRGAASSKRGGGGGGAGGYFVTRLIPVTELTDTVAITVPTGGTGGAAQTADDTNGNNGTSGGDCSFGSLVVAKGGLFGVGGNSNGVSAGGSIQAASLCTPPDGPFSINGGIGGIGRETQGSGQTVKDGFKPDVNGLIASPGGPGACGVSAANVVVSGRPGGGLINAGILISGGVAGSSTGDRNGGDGSQTADKVFWSIDYSVTNMIGSSGGSGAGGDTTGTIDGGNGGNGARGAGGAGGGGCTNGANSGKGGNGGSGVCYLIEYYGA